MTDRARLQKALAEAEAEQANGVIRAAVLALLLLAACTSPEGRLQACVDEGKARRRRRARRKRPRYAGG
jgi:hypothetical protein